MSSFANKISFSLETYARAIGAGRRQYSRRELETLRDGRLRRMTEHAAKNVKYYRELFRQHGIAADSIGDPAALRRLPTLTKETIKQRYWDFFPSEIDECRIGWTSGSTGMPICIFSDRNSRMHNSAAVIRLRKAHGIGLAGRAIITPLPTRHQAVRAPHWTYVQGLHKTYYINPYEAAQPEGQPSYDWLKKVKTPALVGLMSPIRALAFQIRQGTIPAFRPSVVITTGEYLPPQTRLMLEETFSCKVADVYACSEAGDVAWQCREFDGYHINSDNVIMEVLKDGEPAAPGETGEVAVTHLNRFAMPMIRYLTGDLSRVREEECRCGSRLPMIHEILGRSSNDLTLPNGRIVPWKEIRELMVNPLIQQYQVEQDKDGNVAVSFVAGSQSDEKRIEEAVVHRCLECFGPELGVRANAVRRIEPGASGKTQYVRSEYRP